MSLVEIYGLKSCDSCRKARNWLDTHGVDYRFHDLREDPITPGRLRALVRKLGWETLLNRRSTTWRSLAEAERAGLDAETALGLMIDHPTLIKRPVTFIGETILVGFDVARYTAVLEE